MKEDSEIKVPVKPKGTSFCEPLQYKILKDETVNLTPELAFRFLELETFHGERPVRQGHVQYLYDQLISGRFVWHHVSLACARLGNTVYRINGQHTCWMRVNVPKELEPIKAEIQIITYQVEDESNLKALYSTFDRAAARTQGHIGKVQLMDTEAGREIPVSNLGHLITGFRIFFSPDWNKGGGAQRMRIDELTSLINKNYAQLFNIVGRYFGIHYKDAMWVKRSSVLAACFATFEKNVKLSDEFWGPVFSGIGLTKRADPRWQLRRYIESHGLTIEGGKERVSQEQLYCVCINCWNHWRLGNELFSVKTMDIRPKVRS